MIGPRKDVYFLFLGHPVSITLHKRQKKSDFHCTNVGWKWTLTLEKKKKRKKERKLQLDDKLQDWEIVSF